LTDSMFQNEEQQSTEQTTTQETVTQANPAEELLKGIVNENGEQKYQDVDTALKALQASQEHIAKLEAEHVALREQASKAKTAEELLAEVQKTQEVTPSHGEIDTSKLAQLVDERLNALDQANRSRENQDKVVSAMKEVFGDKAGEVFQQKAQDLGLDVGFLESVSAKSPEAALELLGVKNKPQQTHQSQGSVNTETMPTQKPETPPVKNVMFGASRQDWLAEWEACKPSEET